MKVMCKVMKLFKLYIQDKFASISRPLKELKASKRVTIAPKTEEIILFELTRTTFLFTIIMGI